MVMGPTLTGMLTFIGILITAPLELVQVWEPLPKFSQQMVSWVQDSPKRLDKTQSKPTKTRLSTQQSWVSPLPQVSEDTGAVLVEVGLAEVVVVAHGTAETLEMAMAATMMVLENCILNLVDWVWICE
jgi:hypothetical protein